VRAGDDVVRQGEHGSEAFAIVRGICEARQRAEDGSERILRTLKAGDVFGEVAALGGGARTATVTAIEDCELLVVSADDLLPETMQAAPLRSFIAALVGHLRDAERRATRAEGELSRMRASAETITDD
jgi:CRP/FNR family transcriptional regulator, cyclic AMP receptor protein